MNTEAEAVSPYLSVLLPVYNEEGNLAQLYATLTQHLVALGLTYEIIFVDDGSTDASARILRDLAARDPLVRVVVFRRNYGQTAAMSAGIHHAGGEVLIPMDADLQNDPADIPALLAVLDEGYDVVSGWRKDRHDHMWRVWPSRVANRLISAIGGVRLHDYGCSLKAYRRAVIQDVRLYGEMHRFIPIYASWVGARVTEIPVRHHPRQSGVSKYGMNRILKVILDLLTVKFLSSYATKPIYVFGTAGLASLVGSAIACTLALYWKLTHQADFIQTPMPLLGVTLALMGTQFLLMGLLAEMVMRTYHESQGKRIYHVREWINLSPERTG